jgi:predicted membrane protein
MPLIQIVLLLIIAGVVLWLINQYVPMAASIKSILNAVVVVAVIIWLLNGFGLLSTNPKIHLG